MNDLAPPDMALAALLPALALFYAAWHELRARSRRDAGLLAVVGTASLIGSAVVWMP